MSFWKKVKDTLSGEAREEAQRAEEQSQEQRQRKEKQELDATKRDLARQLAESTRGLASEALVAAGDRNLWRLREVLFKCHPSACQMLDMSLGMMANIRKVPMKELPAPSSAPARYGLGLSSPQDTALRARVGLVSTVIPKSALSLETGRDFEADELFGAIVDTQVVPAYCEPPPSPDPEFLGRFVHDCRRLLAYQESGLWHAGEPVTDEMFNGLWPDPHSDPAIGLHRGEPGSGPASEPVDDASPPESAERGGEAELVAALTGDDADAFDAAVLACIARSDEGDTSGRASVRQAIETLAGGPRSFYTPRIALMRQEEEMRAARKRLLEAARWGELLGEPQKFGADLASALSLGDTDELLQEFLTAAEGGNGRALRLLHTQGKCASHLDAVRRVQDRERVLERWGPEASAKAASGGGEPRDEQARSPDECSGFGHECKRWGRDVLLCKQGEFLTCEWSLPEGEKSLCTESCLRHASLQLAAEARPSRGALLAHLAAGGGVDHARRMSPPWGAPWSVSSRVEDVLTRGSAPAVLVTIDDELEGSDEVQTVAADLQRLMDDAKGASPPRRAVPGSFAVIHSSKIEAGDLERVAGTLKVLDTSLAEKLHLYVAELVPCGTGFLGNPNLHERSEVRAWVETLSAAHPEILLRLAPKTLALFLCAKGLATCQMTTQGRLFDWDTEEVEKAFTQAFDAWLEKGDSGLAALPPLFQHQLAYTVATNLLDARTPDDESYLVYWPTDKIEMPEVPPSLLGNRRDPG